MMPATPPARIPQVSIIIPLHNKGAYIHETLESVCRQTHVDWEAIVVENGSNDNGPEIARSMQAKDSRIRLIEAASNVRGPGAARNLGIQEATGEWIQFLDADDILLPGHFEKQLLATKRSPEVGIITCDWLEGKSIDEKDCELKHPTNFYTSTDCQASAIAYTPWVVHAAWIKKTALGNPPWWDVSFDQETSEDNVFWFRVLQTNNYAYSNHVGVYYRTETENRRHNKSHINKHLQIVDRTILVNIQYLTNHIGKVKYHHRKNLFRIYLSQLIEQHINTETELKIYQRIKDFRPNLMEAFFHKDLAALISYILPLKTIATIQERRRQQAKKQTGT